MNIKQVVYLFQFCGHVFRENENSTEETEINISINIYKTILVIYNLYNLV